MRSIGWYHRAIIARLKSAVDPVTQVVDRQPSGRPARYIQVATSGGTIRPVRLNGSRWLDLPIMIMSVGVDPDNAFDALAQCDLALIGWDIDPADPSATIMERDDSWPPLIPYRSVEGDERFSITPTYRLGTDR